MLANKLVVLLLSLLMIASASAQTGARPRVGLVLGGGGARGTAHIGVLEVLEKMRVPVDCIAGTSMGSLIGGAYISGLSPQQMIERLAPVDWRDLFEDNPSQAEMNYRDRHLALSYYPGLEVGVASNNLRTIHGVVGGQKIKLFFNTLVGADKGERDIKSLPLPLAIIATDIGTGEKVVFREGELSAAMRASMSVPALLSPVRYQGRHLVDGGLVDNLPVHEVKALCNADVVIAIDVGSPLLKPESVDSILSVSFQMIGVLTEQNANASRALLTSEDIYIKPDLDGISASDFNKFREGAARGRIAAQAQAEKLRRLAVPEAQYIAWQEKRNLPPQASPRINEVQIADLNYVNPEAVRKHLHVDTEQPLDVAQLERDIGRIYGDGDYESVDYSVLHTRERNILRITPIEKSWGPNYLRFGMNLEAGSKENDLALRAAYHKKWLNALGGEWLSGVQVGERSSAFTELYQPLDERQRFFVEPALAISKSRLSIYQDDNRIAQYQIRERWAGLNVGANLGVLGQFRFGRVYRDVDNSVETGSTSLPVGDIDLKGWRTSLDINQFNLPFFPTKGWAANARYFRESDLGYGKFSSDLRAAYSWGPYILNGRLSYVNALTGQLPLVDAGSLGGFLNLSGYARNQILAGDIRFGSIRGEKIIGKMPLGVAGDIRIGLSLEAGKARDRFTETNVEGWQHAAAIYLGGDTPLGPLFLGYGLARGGVSSIYLFIGLP